MKKQKDTQKKFDLQKFEIAKLKTAQLGKLKGGLDVGADVYTTTGGHGDKSSIKCLG